MKKAVFLDRDGTLILEKHYLHKPEEVELFAEAIPALKSLQHAGFELFLVTNQSGVGRGYFSIDDVHRVHAHIQSLLAPAAVVFRAIYIAPEAPDQPSRGRKPSPQFLWDARDEFHLDLSSSYMIGDKRVDLECGWNAGVRKSILVRTGYGAELERQSPETLTQALVVSHLSEAARYILSDQA